MKCKMFVLFVLIATILMGCGNVQPAAETNHATIANNGDSISHITDDPSTPLDVTNSSTAVTTPTAPTTEEGHGEGRALPDGFMIDCDYVLFVRDHDIYWEWEIADLSVDAEVITLNRSMMFAVVQDGDRIWLINGRENAQLLTNEGLVTKFFAYDSIFFGYLHIDDGALYYDRLYPFSMEETEPVLLAEGVEKIVSSRIFVRDGHYWMLTTDAIDWEEDGVGTEAVDIGEASHRIITRDIDRLNKGEMSIDDFETKYLWIDLG